MCCMISFVWYTWRDKAAVPGVSTKGEHGRGFGEDGTVLYLDCDGYKTACFNSHRTYTPKS